MYLAALLFGASCVVLQVDELVRGEDRNPLDLLFENPELILQDSHRLAAGGVEFVRLLFAVLLGYKVRWWSAGLGVCFYREEGRYMQAGWPMSRRPSTRAPCSTLVTC